MMRFATVIAILGLAASVTAAEAKIHKHVANGLYLGPYPQGTSVKLDSTGATSVAFTLKKAAMVAITFSAECSLMWGDYAQIDIRVDDISLMPVGDDAVFCSKGGYVTASRTVAKDLAKGAHAVSVRIGNGFAAYVQLDDTTLTIFE